jgi:hypothetical protein
LPGLILRTSAAQQAGERPIVPKAVSTACNARQWAEPVAVATHLPNGARRGRLETRREAMPCHSIVKSLAVAAIAATAMVAHAAPSAAQTYYGGYNLGPDYGAMIQQQQQLMQQQRMQMQSHEQQIIAQVMQHPNFAPMYQQHRAQGGQMSPQQFAYTLAATRWGSPEGRAYFQQTERQNQMREHDAARGLRSAETQRGNAQRQYMEGGHGIRQESGNGLQSRGTYVGPNGETRVLPYNQPGAIQQDAQGNRYIMNNQGQYFMATPNGWVPMQPRY